LFADDRNLFVHAKDFNNVIEKSGKCVNDSSVWFFANKLSISTEKTMYTVFDLYTSIRILSKDINKIFFVYFTG